ncbi:hypothetical protein EDB84DRAFT_1447649, partial [Lactarius hengduanensis]
LSLAGDDDFMGSNLGLQINAISFALPPSNSPALFPVYTPSLPSSPVSRSASPSGIRTPSQIALLNIAALSDELPPPSLPAIIDLTLDDIDDAADAILFASPSPSFVPAPLPPPSLPSLPPSALLSLPVVMEDKDLIEGVKTFETSVFILDVVAPNPSLTYYPHIFLPQNRDHHEQSASTEVEAKSPRNYASVALQQRIEDWCAQIASEQTSRPTHPVSTRASHTPVTTVISHLRQTCDNTPTTTIIQTVA